MMPHRPLSRNASVAMLAIALLALPANVGAHGGFGSLGLTLEPPVYHLSSANETAVYTLDVHNHGNASITVHLDLRNVTANWTASLERDVVHLGPHANASIEVTFEPPAGAPYGSSGQFTIEGRAGHNDTAVVSGYAVIDVPERPLVCIAHLLCLG